MANNKNNDNSSIENLSKQNKRIINGIEEIKNSTSSSIFGNDQDYTDEVKTSLNLAKESIAKITDKYKNNTGSGVLEFFTKLSLMDYDPIKGKASIPNKLNNSQKNRGTSRIINELLTGPNSGPISELFFNERNRLTLYNDYQLLYDYIPQLAQAIDTYVDNIISPDDFTKTVFNIFYNNASIDSEDVSSLIKDNIKKINETYKIEEKSQLWIRETLINGDCFVAILKLKNEFEKFINEGASLDDLIITESNDLLNEDSFILEQSDLDSLHQIDEFKDKDESELKKIFTETLTKNIDVYKNSDILLKEYLDTCSDFLNENSKISSINKKVNNNDGFIPVNNKDIDNSFILDKLIKKQNSQFINSERKNYQKVNINGSYLKKLDARKIVKVNIGETVFGYFYIDESDSVLDNPNIISKNLFNNSLVTQNGVPGGTIDVTVGTDGSIIQGVNVDNKIKIVGDIFCKNLGVMLDKKFIEKNKDFKELIYELLHQDYLTKKRMRIIFLAPEEVEHFKINGDGIYGESLFKKILFTAKIYLAVLTCNLMMKLSRSADHRSFYIETGLSNDVEGQIQSFIRDLKTKEVKLQDLNSIDTIFNAVGQFHDYYIPVIDGEKAVDIDTIQGMNTETDNDFLDYLRKSLISGMGIPSNYLNYNDEVEFAKSLSMINSKFIRNIIMLQKSLGSSFTSLYRKIYSNEYENIKDSEGNRLVDVNEIDKIEVKFPSPGSLNISNTSEQIGQSQQVIDYIVSTILGQNVDEDKKDKATLAVAKDVIPTIEWNKYEELIKNSQKEVINDKLINDNENDMLSSDMSSDDNTSYEDNSSNNEFSNDEEDSDFQ